MAPTLEMEHLADFDQTEILLALFRGQHAGQRGLDLVHRVVDDVVVADIDAEVSASLRAPASARVLKPMMTAPEACARLTSDSLMPPTAPWMTLTRTSSVDSLTSVMHQRFLGTLHVGLDDERQGL